MHIRTLIAACLLAAISVMPTTTARADVDGGLDQMRIMAAGDSITLGAGAKRGWSYPEQLQRLCGRKDCLVENVGHGSTCVITVGCLDPNRLVDTFDREVLDWWPDLILITIGRNDLCHAPTADLKEGWRVLRDKADAANVPIMFGTITPAGRAWRWPCEEQRVEINDWIRANLPYIDFEKALSTRAGLLRDKFAYQDGLHPNAAGYAKMAAVTARALGISR